MTTIKRRIHPDVEQAITELARLTDFTPGQIHKRLSALEKYDNRVPHLRTVERIVKEVRQDRGTDLWTLAGSEGEEARYILEVRRELIKYHEQSIQRFTQDEAEWVEKIRKAAPDLPPDIAWLVAVVYRRFHPLVQERGEDEIIDGLDDYLAFAPWRNEGYYRDYKKAVEQGWITPAPMWDRLVEQQNPMARTTPFTARLGSGQHS